MSISCEDVCMLFLRILRNVLVYPKEHPLISQGVESLMEFIGEHDGLIIEVNKGYLYVNSDRVGITAANYLFLRLLIQSFNTLGVGEVECLGGLVEKEHLYGFFSAMAKATDYEELVSLMDREGIAGIVVRPSPEDSKEWVREKARKLYFHTIKVVRSFFETGEVSPVKMKAAASYLLDLLRHSEEALLGLTIIKNYDNYTYNHCLNVAILSLAMGLRIGMERRLLVSLGAGALMHDIGKVKVPIEIINKPSKLDDSEWKLVRRHPVIGSLIVLKNWGISKETSLILEPVVEHHLGMNYYGYPEWLRTRETPLMAGIIHIADFYDAVTTPRVYHKRTFSPMEAMQYLLDNAGVRFDPILVKVFFNVMGFYPVGSIVKLSTGEWGVVVEMPSHAPYFDKPVVVLAANSDGRPLPPKRMDLKGTDVTVAGVSNQSLWNVGLDPTKLALCPIEEQ